MTVDLQFFIQMVIALVTFLGGFIMKGQSDTIKELQAANARLADRFQDYVHKDEFREFRIEHRENFRRLFEKVDEVSAQIAQKADRNEVTR